ncbi:MAG: hypothetical protein Q9222_006642 [Ikaeria aurantiellina]
MAIPLEEEELQKLQDELIACENIASNLMLYVLYYPKDNFYLSGGQANLVPVEEVCLEAFGLPNLVNEWGTQPKHHPTEISEEAAWEQSRSPSSDVPEIDEAQYYVADGSLRHHDCRAWEHCHFDCTNRAALSPFSRFLTVFYVCRQLSASSFDVFWRTNTFSFGDSLDSFNRFISTLAVAQLTSVRALDLIINHWPCAVDFNPYELAQMGLLDVVHLCIWNFHLQHPSNMESAGLPTPDVREIDIRKTTAGAVLQLETLNIRNLTVVVYDNALDYVDIRVPHTIHFNNRYTLMEKRDLADIIRATVLSPDRKAHAQRTRQIYALEQVLRGMKYTQDVAWQLQHQQVRKALEERIDSGNTVGDD